MKTSAFQSHQAVLLGLCPLLHIHSSFRYTYSIVISSIYLNIVSQTKRLEPNHLNLKTSKDKMYPRVKVRVQEEDDHSPPPNDSQSSLFPSLIESLSQQEKENQISSPPSIARLAKAYVKSPETKSLSAAKDAGTVKNDNQIGKDAKSNAKANYVPPPRAVLSSPDNDGMIGCINKLNHARSAASKKRPVERINPAGQTHKNYLSPNATPSSQNFKKGPKTENINQSPKFSAQRKDSKSENRSLAGRLPKEPSKPVVQRQKARIGRKSSSPGI